jgi:adenylate cyclase
VRQGIDEARMLAHSHTLAWALCHACLFHLLRREAAAAEALAGELVEIARKQRAELWAAIGRPMLSCARAGRPNASADSIAQLRRDIEATQALKWWARTCIDVLAAEILGAAGDVPSGLRLLKETQTSIEQWEQRLLEAEAYRARAELLRAAGSTAGEAEADLARAIDVARGQKAKTFELRAAMSLARLRRGQGRRGEACDLLTPIYGWFTEGFDTPDLQEAKTLLDELR